MIEVKAANTGKILAIGHRGALGYAPENTMSSFKQGLDMGADVLELDVHVSGDGELVVMHDASVERTTDGQGKLKTMRLGEIKKLDAGAKFDRRFRGERVPTLAEVLDWARGRIALAIEIKGDPQPDDGVGEKLVGLIRTHDMSDEVAVISFYHDAVKRVKQLAPELCTGIIYECQLADTAGCARAASADSVRPEWHFWTRKLVEQVHQAGLIASSWVANDDLTMGQLADMAIDSIVSDYPDRLRSYLDRIGRSW